MTGPFTGLRILDFSRDKSGKYASMIMSDMGAEVIRVAHLEAKVSVDPEDRLFNRGKKSITLELNFQMNYHLSLLKMGLANLHYLNQLVLMRFIKIFLWYSSMIQYYFNILI